MAYNLKDEADTQLYIENLGIEYRFGCYHEKKPEVCHLLADFFEAVKKDWEKAGKLYEVNCDQYNYGHSCFKYGNYSFVGKGGAKLDHKKAVEYYDKGCSLKYPEACLHAGLMRTSANSQLEKDQKTAYTNFDAGCSMNNSMCCFYVSGMFIAGVKDLFTRDMEKAFQYSVKACHLGNMYACSNLSQMYKKGEGVDKNDKKAEEYRSMATEMQDQVVKQFRTIKFEETSWNWDQLHYSLIIIRIIYPRISHVEKKYVYCLNILVWTEEMLMC